MNCPVCGGDNKVICSRKDCESIYRRRKCLDCGYIFYTTELEMKSSDRDFHLLDAERQREYKLARHPESNCRIEGVNA